MYDPRRVPVAIAVLLALSGGPAMAQQQQAIIVQSTTSTANSGLYDHLLPVIARQTGITAHIVAVGTGQAIRNARNCDGDVLLVHARDAEEQFVADGYGVCFSRADLMYNDFVIVGPVNDPAGIAGTTDAVAAMTRIAASRAPFASRSDDSGTHRAEQRLWAAAGIDPTAASGKWYRETGSGMGATLNAAIGMNAYALTDRATWIGYANKRDFTVAVEADKRLFNQYGIILVNPAKCPSVREEAGRRFIAFLLSGPGQDAIAAFRVDGQQLFFPNAANAPM